MSATPLPRQSRSRVATPDVDPARVAHHLSDTGNAERLIKQFGDDIRWCDPWGRWLVWTEGRWRVDDLCLVQDLAKQTVRSIYEEAAALKQVDPRAQKAIRTWAHASESRRARENLVAAARSESLPAGDGRIAITHDQLDESPWLLNVRNGTIDLRSGQLREHRRGDFLTKQADVVYDEQAECPTWTKFLWRITNENEELVTFLKRAVGYSLTGSIAEQCLFFAYGLGSNGKSTLLETLVEVCGDYATPIPSDLLLAKKNESHPTGLTCLFKARLAVAQEVEAGRAWAEVLIKQLTGGDSMMARRMREDFWSFIPTHKLWIAANHKPIVRGTDKAIWRRIRLIPFSVTILDDEKDRDLPQKLAAERAGILRWAVEGALEWQQRGLGEPDVVTRATSAYRNEMDVIGRFLEEACELDPNAWEPMKQLYAAYVRWCSQSGEHPLKKSEFGERLTERGMPPKRAAANKPARFGVRILPDSAGSEGSDAE